MIKTGDMLPDARLIRMGPDGPEDVDLRDKLAGRKVVIFGLPGAFTPTCDSAHLPSFIRTAGAFAQKGVDEIICVSVNDAHVMRYWGRQSGAIDAGITMLADADSSFTKAIGLEFSVPKVGFFDRSRRYAMLVEDGAVRVLHLEKPGECSISTGEELLEAI
ncbi:MAG: peroxiredoxin [Rhodobacter sp.]|nr:peroxiredoxin [Rhodobacter sp.]